MKKLLRRKKRGVIAVEWIILFPLAFMLVMFSIMYLIFTMNFLTLSNSATDLAQMMNMGDSAYKEYTGGRTNYNGRSYTVLSRSDAGAQLVVSLAEKQADHHINTYATSTGEGAFENAFYDKLGAMVSDGRFDVPFCTIHEINCYTYCGESGGGVTEDHSFNTHERETESGNMIDVEVKYDFLFLHMEQHGYSFII